MNKEKLVKRLETAQRFVWCATHTNTRFGCDCFCYLAEAVAPGFTDLTWRQIRAKVSGNREENQRAYEDGIRLMLNMRKWMFVHVFILWIGVKIVESHDPFFKEN